MNKIKHKNIKVIYDKLGVATYHGCVRIKGFDPLYKSNTDLSTVLAWQKEAVARIRKAQREAAEPRAWLPPSGDLADQSLREILNRYAETLPSKRRSSKAATIPSALMVCGDPTVGQLKPSWIKKLIRRARQTPTKHDGSRYAWATIKLQLSVIGSAIKWRADELDLIPPPFTVTNKMFEEACAAEGLRKSDLNNERDRRFEPGEAEALMKVVSNMRKNASRATREQWPLFIQFAIHTGARLEEIAWAEWSEIDATGEWWRIPDEHSKTKTREMVLIDEAMDILEKMKLLRKPGRKRIFDVGEPRECSNRFARHSRMAGLENFTFHDIRHEGISRLVLTQRTLTVKHIMTMVGHSSMKMLDRYAKLRPHELAPLIIRRPKPSASPEINAIEPPSMVGGHINAEQIGSGPRLQERAQSPSV